MKRCVLAAVVSLAAGSAAASEDTVRLAPLHVIPMENPSAQPLPAKGPLRLRLSSPDAGALAQALGVKLDPGQPSFEYVIEQYPQLRPQAERTWLESTFVIDFDEPEFAELRKEVDAFGPKPSRAQLVDFVAGYIEASDDRGWDLASVVARRRKGDCSEHAVLTTALARLRGIPARVVIGVALVSEGSSQGAFGHAWSEFLVEGQWQVADAALAGFDATVRYLPLGLIEDEGMGYTMDLMRLIRVWIDRVVVLGR